MALGARLAAVELAQRRARVKEDAVAEDVEVYDWEPPVLA